MKELFGVKNSGNSRFWLFVPNIHLPANSKKMFKRIKCNNISEGLKYENPN